MLLVAGITNTFPVFLPALLAEFGGSRAATTSTASLLWLKGAVLSTLAGYLVARGDPRLLVSIGLGLTGMTTHAALIADAYVHRRGLATGIAFGGSMAAYALAPPAQWAISHWGWRPAALRLPRHHPAHALLHRA